MCFSLALGTDGNLRMQDPQEDVSGLCENRIEKKRTWKKGKIDYNTIYWSMISIQVSQDWWLNIRYR